MMDSDWKPMWNSRIHATSLTPETPYWGSYARLRFTASNEAVVAAYSFLYPLHLYNLSGDVANLAVVADSLLAVTHGTLKQLGATRRVVEEHHSVDFYDLRTRVKIAEDVELPPITRVVAGGRRGLHAISEEPPNPWTISILELRQSK